ncbi:MAG TPA: hypothetical protein VHU18_11500 [Rhizomicrobium sp.]|jgi:ElaB/YqjD/DUF883 family membrane-anchored ribosome-binding protein|nr:hypothetical protein [Rhizomicrobium sp.]
MSQLAAELEKESEQHRANIAALLDELRSRATPGEIVNQMLGPDAGRDLIQVVTREARRQVQKNPLPFAVIGAGLAWLLLANALKRQRQIPLHDGLDYEDYPELQDRPQSGILDAPQRVLRHLSETMKVKSSDAGGRQEEAIMSTQSEKGSSSRGSRRANSRNAADLSDADVQVGESALQDSSDSQSSRGGFMGRSMEKAKDAAGRAQQMATDAAHAALQKSGETFSDAADTVGQAASSLLERTNEMARRTGRAASHTASRTGSGIGQLAREQPILVAGVGFALGVALGALLPLTRQENEMLGEQAERLKDSARDMASDGYEKVKSVAQRTYEAAAETLKGESENQGMAGSGSQSASGETGKTYGTDNGGDTSTGAYRH